MADTKFITLSEARRRIHSRYGIGLHPATVRRWLGDEAVRVGGRLFVPDSIIDTLVPPPRAA